MATKIIHKKSSVAEKIPLSTDLEVGELALNLLDRKIYSKQTDGTVVEMAPNVIDSEITSFGSWTLGEPGTAEWSIVESSGSILFKYGAVTAMTFSSDGGINISGDLYQGGTVPSTPINSVVQGNTEWSYHHSTTDFFFQYGQTNMITVDEDGDLIVPGDFEGNATISGNTASSYYFYFSGTPVIEITSTGDLKTVASLDTNATI